MIDAHSPPWQRIPARPHWAIMHLLSGVLAAQQVSHAPALMTLCWVGNGLACAADIFGWSLE